MKAMSAEQQTGKIGRAVKTQIMPQCYSITSTSITIPGGVVKNKVWILAWYVSNVEITETAPHTQITGTCSNAYMNEYTPTPAEKINGFTIDLSSYGIVGGYVWVD